MYKSPQERRSSARQEKKKSKEVKAQIEAANRESHQAKVVAVKSALSIIFEKEASKGGLKTVELVSPLHPVFYGILRVIAPDRVTSDYATGGFKERHFVARVGECALISGVHVRPGWWESGGPSESTGTNHPESRHPVIYSQDDGRVYTGVRNLPGSSGFAANFNYSMTPQQILDKVPPSRNPYDDSWIDYEQIIRLAGISE